VTKKFLVMMPMGKNNEKKIENHPKHKQNLGERKSTPSS
jgi:hypothetical protein